jgi:hypothetical protein
MRYPTRSSAFIYRKFLEMHRKIVCFDRLLAALWPEKPRKSVIATKMVGDPGIEPGMSRLGGVTVRCHTL